MGSTGYAHSYAIKQNSGRTLSFWGSKVILYATGEETKGAYAIFEYVAPPNQPGPGLHVHRNFDETFFVLEGILRLQLGNEEFVLEQGGFAIAARGTPHRPENVGSGLLRGLSVVTPAGFEQYFVDLSALAASLPSRPPSPEQIQEIVAKYDVYLPQDKG